MQTDANTAGPDNRSVAAVEVHTAHELIQLLDDVTSWSKVHDLREGDEADAIDALVHFIEEVIRFDVLAPLTEPEKVELAQDIQPLFDELQVAGLRVFGCRYPRPFDAVEPYAGPAAAAVIGITSQAIASFQVKAASLHPVVLN